jgi:hypothetical protein
MTLYFIRGITRLFHELVNGCPRLILAIGGFDAIGRIESQPLKAQAATMARMKRNRRKSMEFIGVSARGE